MIMKIIMTIDHLLGKGFAQENKGVFLLLIIIVIIIIVIITIVIIIMIIIDMVII